MIGRPARYVVRLFGGAVAAALVIVAAQAWPALGARPSGERRRRMEGSPEWHNGHFVNPQPLRNQAIGSLRAMLHPSPWVSPTQPVPTAVPDPSLFKTAPPSGLRVTWFGHSSTLLEIDGLRILTDPVWSARASPLSWVGPQRWYAPPLALADLPPIDAVVISHDHYDHLDRETIRAMREWKTLFIVPLGVGADLEAWGIAPERIRELDWWEETRLPGLTVVCTPARHASGRMGIDEDSKLWASYAFVGARHRVYYSGDSGLFPALADIGARLGPFDLTLIEVGQYDQAWPDWHMGPEQAVRAHQMVRGKVLLPIHWGAFALAAHGWTEPIERAWAASSSAGVALMAPEPGESVEPEHPTPVRRWWPPLPWRTAAEDPIVSTQVP